MRTWGGEGAIKSRSALRENTPELVLSRGFLLELPLLRQHEFDQLNGS